MAVLLDKADHLIKAAAFVKAFHVLPRNHNLMSTDFGKINGVLNDFALCIIDNTVFLRGIDNQFDFFFGVSLIRFIGNFNAHNLQNQSGNMVKHPDKRRKNHIKTIKGVGNAQNIFFGMNNSQRFRH